LDLGLTKAWPWRKPWRCDGEDNGHQKPLQTRA
jgi:hypothetical protein